MSALEPTLTLNAGLLASIAARHKNLVERTCGHCGGVFITKASLVKIGKGKYCSASCARTKINEKKRAAKGVRVTLECGVCGKHYERHPSTAGKSKYCSIKCKDKSHAPAYRLKREG